MQMDEAQRTGHPLEQNLLDNIDALPYRISVKRWMRTAAMEYWHGCDAKPIVIVRFALARLGDVPGSRRMGVPHDTTVAARKLTGSTTITTCARGLLARSAHFDLRTTARSSLLASGG
jgi:hypothetical protein